MSRDGLLHEQARALLDQFTRSDKFHHHKIAVDAFGDHKNSLEVVKGSGEDSFLGTSNVVLADDLNRLKNGSEQRTTLMIKKVPRKYGFCYYSSFTLGIRWILSGRRLTTPFRLATHMTYCIYRWTVPK